MTSNDDHPRGGNPSSGYYASRFDGIERSMSSHEERDENRQAELKAEVAAVRDALGVIDPRQPSVAMQLDRLNRAEEDRRESRKRDRALLYSILASTVVSVILRLFHVA